MGWPDSGGIRDRQGMLADLQPLEAHG